jgi:Zn finger protein HypA/HybF involved in hydrogenase expression
MHEIALAQSAWEITVSAANQNRLATVERIYFNRSKRSCVCEESFITAFEHIARGSIAENAEIVISPIDASTGADFEITGIEGDCNEN